jgi:hypothetical protein
MDRFSPPVILLLILACTISTATAKLLSVGPDQVLKMPCVAASIAAAGDTITIAPGEYFDCAVWSADKLTIEGADDAVVITDKVCQGKALFVITGNDVTIRNLTFMRARVPDGNGAGIRAEGRNLRVEHSRFVNNESGILASDTADSAITIVDSDFTDNGRCQASCGHAIYVGRIAYLRVERSKFTGTKAGHHIKTRALRTELSDDDIIDGPNGTSSYLVDLPNGGSLVMVGNRLEKGAKSSTPGVAIITGEEGLTLPVEELRIIDNIFTNDTGRSTIFLKNWTGSEPIMTGNTHDETTTLVSRDGYWVHLISSWIKDVVASMKAAIGFALKPIRYVLSKLHG